MSTPLQGTFPPRPTEPTPPFDVGSTGPTMPMPPFPRTPRPGGGGSAMEGLGQVDQGGRVIGTALGRAQQANQASSEAIGGGGGFGGVRKFGSDPRSLAHAVMKKGGKVKAHAKGGMVSGKPKASSASSRGDGIAQRGKTKGRFI